MENLERQSQWVEIVAIFLAAVGGLAAVAGAVLVGLSQAQATGLTIWPLPGLVLADWLILGAAGLFLTILTVRSASPKWLLAIWLLTGAFIPLIILGVLTIAPYVLVSYVLFLISTLILAFRQRPKWLDCFASFMLGLIVNLGLLWVIISLGNAGR